MEDRRIGVSQPSTPSDVAGEKQSLNALDSKSSFEEDAHGICAVPRLPELVFCPFVPFSGPLFGAGPDTYDVLHHQISQKVKSSVRRAGTVKRRMTLRGDFHTQAAPLKVRRKPVASSTLVSHSPS